MKTLNLSQRLKDILNEEKKQIVTLILEHRRITNPNFDEFNEICELWSWNIDDLNTELTDLINDQFAGILTDLKP